MPLPGGVSRERVVGVGGGWGYWREGGGRDRSRGQYQFIERVGLFGEVFSFARLAVTICVCVGWVGGGGVDICFFAVV